MKSFNQHISESMPCIHNGNCSCKIPKIVQDQCRTRLEGLLAALTFLPDEQRVFRRKIKSIVSNGISFLLRSQVSSGKYVGGIPRAIGKLPSIHPSYSEKFNKRATEIRIDYVQHALNAMIQYSEFFEMH